MNKIRDEITLNMIDLQLNEAPLSIISSYSINTIKAKKNRNDLILESLRNVYA